MHPKVTRREMIGAALCAGAGTAAGLTHPATARGEDQRSDEPFMYGLNTSTLRGHELSLPEEIDIAGRAGYRGLELWVSELEQYSRDGGSLKDLGKRIADLGMSVESVIGFSEWIVDDDARRARGMEDARRTMDLMVQIGGKRLAAPPSGATDVENLNLAKAAERYRALLELGDSFGVVPQVELWGFSKSLHLLGEVTFVAIESGHPKACILPDVYHMYKGGSDPTGLRLLSGNALHVIHMNDYPAKPGRNEITDAHRVYPGDGVAPLKMILTTLREIGFRGMLSLELFNREYWQEDALLVARRGLEKMQAAVQASLA